MNNLDRQYTELLKTIIEYGIDKTDRTGTGTRSIFGYTIRHSMSEGFPLLTTKKMFTKGIVEELLWFLRGETNIAPLVKEGVNIWVGDAYKNYTSKTSINTSNFDEWMRDNGDGTLSMYTEEEFIDKIKNDSSFAKKWGNIGPVYGKQWRKWTKTTVKFSKDRIPMGFDVQWVDQLSNLISELKKNPDSRRLMLTAWQPAELDQMVLPPCHYGFQLYTRELSWEEKVQWVMKNTDVEMENLYIVEEVAKETTPKRAISLIWNQRSVDTFLGLPFNIASYGLLLEILAKTVNMIPDQLIGNLGDTHIYNNHFEQVNEQLGRNLSLEERIDLWFKEHKPNRDVVDHFDTLSEKEKVESLDKQNVPSRTRIPYKLPKLVHNRSYEFYDELSRDTSLISQLSREDFKIVGYESHLPIKGKLSN